MSRTWSLVVKAVVVSTVAAVIGWQASALPPLSGRPHPMAEPRQAASPVLIGKRPPLHTVRPAWLGTTVAASALFAARFKNAFSTLDKNGDGRLEWAVIDPKGKIHIDQAGPEPLPPSYDACYLIDYVRHPATKEKDPAHPGQYVETPESYEITGWKPWKEVLAHAPNSGYADTVPTGDCNKKETKTYCHYPSGFDREYLCGLGGCSCEPGQGGVTLVTKEVCTQPVTVPEAFTEKAWLDLAADHFKREDWNHDGKLDAAESAEFICPAGP